MEGQEYVPVPVATLIANTVPDFALYLTHPDYPGRRVLYRKQGLVLSKDHLARLQRHGVDHVYILAQDRPLQHRYMVESARQLLDDPATPAPQKAAMIYEFSKSAVQCAFDEPCEQNIKTCRDLAQEQVRYVVSDPQAVASLLRIISHDYYTYTHSVNVCSFTVALCRRAGIDDLERLKVIGIGAMLHDVGKSRIDRAIINKPGALSPLERKEIRRHPELGMALLTHTNPVPPEAEELVLGHHEKCDGSGYPRGLAADDLSLPVRACAIADVFDALTTHRSYKHARSAFDSLNLMQRKMSRQLDPVLLAEFIRLIGEASREAARRAA